MEFAYDGGGLGQGRRRHALRRRRARSARGASTRTVPMVFSADETTDVGSDTATPVSDDYGADGQRLHGRVRWVQIDLDEEPRTPTT